jgi:hypothetical protein
MNIGTVEKIANAVLYEGYLLYPYRASAVKNQQRFNFGVLYPRAYCEIQPGSEASETTTECIVLSHVSTTVEVKVRFLQLITRDGRQEGQEREVCTPVRTLESILRQPFRQEFAFAGGLVGELQLCALRLDEQLFKLTLNIRNRAKLNRAGEMSRDDVLLRSFVSVHSILQVTGGEFVSLLDPPEPCQSAVAACQNIGAWPVLVGEEGQRNMLLSAPIILYDYPQIAPESAGDLFDGTEIDEILALRILTMTDAEKLEIRNGDDRARQILERTEMMPLEHFQKLHGALRGLSAHPENKK